MNRSIIAFVLVAVLLIIYFSRGNYTNVKVNNRQWHVIGDFSNKRDAAQLLAKTNSIMIEFFRVLKKKYHIDEPDDIIAHDYIELRKHPGDVYNIIDNLLDNYNPDVFYENDPRGTTETSYTINKGSAMYVCLRNKVDPRGLVDPSALLFVMLHEASHIANYNGWGHGPDFWATFKFILHEAALAGIYTPVDYATYPVEYCGLSINYNPLYDESLPNLWEL